LTAILLFIPAAVYAVSIGGVDTQGKGRFGFGLDQGTIP